MATIEVFTADELLTTFVHNFINIFSIHSGYGNGMLIPYLHKILAVGRHFSRFRFKGCNETSDTG